MVECRRRTLIFSRSPPLFRHSLAQVRRRSWAPKCSIPICFDDCSTTDQTAQSLSVSRFTFPLLETERSRRPSSMPAAIIQALMPCFTQMGMATVRMRRPLPSRLAPPLALLDGRDVELGQLVPPQGAANQKGQDHVVAFALERRAVGDGQQLL